MSIVNKLARREEFDTLKGQFEKLSADGKMSDESLTLKVVAIIRHGRDFCFSEEIMDALAKRHDRWTPE